LAKPRTKGFAGDVEHYTQINGTFDATGYELPEECHHEYLGCLVTDGPEAGDYRSGPALCSCTSYADELMTQTWPRNRSAAAGEYDKFGSPLKRGELVEGNPLGTAPTVPEEQASPSATPSVAPAMQCEVNDVELPRLEFLLNGGARTFRPYKGFAAEGGRNLPAFLCGVWQVAAGVTDD
jgi:hypothetical protein